MISYHCLFNLRLFSCFGVSQQEMYEVNCCVIELFGDSHRGTATFTPSHCAIVPIVETVRDFYTAPYHFINALHTVIANRGVV